MDKHLIPSDLRLEHQAIYRLDDAAGIQLACREGTVWVTLDDDPRDFVLEPGDTFKTQEHRRAIVYALKPSRISMLAIAQARHGVPARGLQIESGLRAGHA